MFHKSDVESTGMCLSTKDDILSLHNRLFKIETHLETLITNTDKLTTVILGDDDDHIGLVRKVDRLEQKEADRRWHFRTIWTALVALTSGLALKVFGG